MPRRRALRLLAVGSGVLVVVLLAVAVVGLTVVRRPLPDHDGTTIVAALDDEVRVLRDARGVPTIVATTVADLYRGQGYADAQDRFFQMDLRRHITSGRLAELVGDDPAAIEADVVVRTLGWRRVAEAEWALLDDSARDNLQAYADGVNAYLGTRDPTALAVEYTVLDTLVDVAEPEPWDPVDSLAWLKAIAWDLRGNADDELARAEAYASVRDVAMVEQLFPRASAGSPIVPDAAVTTASARAGVDPSALDLDTAGLEDVLASAQAALDAVPRLLGEGDGLGSNSWVVSGDHTASGAPLLANDPHLGLEVPGVLSQVTLRCAEVTDDCPVEVSGFGFAGFPGVIIGHTADLAWGLTTMGADVSDLFLERTDRDEGTYLVDGRQEAISTRTETVLVAGGDPIEVEVRSTAHGPIISTVLTGQLRSAPAPAGGRGEPEVSLAWTGLEPGRTAEAVFAFTTARTASDVAAAAALFEVPPQNIVFATTDGHIGYQAPGRIRGRATVTDGPVPSDGTWPRPGWDSRYDWQGWVAPTELPAVLDPAEGFLVAANQQVSASGPFLAVDWDTGYRARRIRSVLEQQIADGTPVDVASTQALQLDSWSPFADALVPALLAAPVDDGFTGQAVELLRGWDREMTRDSAAAAYFAAVWDELLDLTFSDDLPESHWPDGGDRWLAVVSGLLEQENSPWWDDRTTVNVVESRDEILARSLTQARLELTVELGKDPNGWQWGRLHRAAPTHAVLGGSSLPWPVRQLVNPRPVALDGGSSIVNATSWDAASRSFDVVAGPAMRMVTDLADWDAATWVVATGTSGHPGSPHYTDQVDAWATGKQYPWPFTAPAVEQAATSTLVLRPGT